MAISGGVLGCTLDRNAACEGQPRIAEGSQRDCLRTQAVQLRQGRRGKRTEWQGVRQSLRSRLARRGLLIQQPPCRGPGSRLLSKSCARLAQHRNGCEAQCPWKVELHGQLRKFPSPSADRTVRPEIRAHQGPMLPEIRDILKLSVAGPCFRIWPGFFSPSARTFHPITPFAPKRGLLSPPIPVAPSAFSPAKLSNLSMDDPNWSVTRGCSPD